MTPRLAPATRAATTALTALLFASAAGAQSRPRQRFPYPAPLWIVSQLVPSPELVVTSGDAYFGLRWQVTPLLLAFSLRPGINPWRVLVAEPVVRYGGSVELFVSPEYLALPGDFAQQWGLRTGLRAYVPLVSRGESLAAFLGTSHFLYRGEHSVGLDVGVCVLIGLLGAQVTYVPRMMGSDAWIFTLRLRYF